MNKTRTTVSRDSLRELNSLVKALKKYDIRPKRVASPSLYSNPRTIHDVIECDSLSDLKSLRDKIAKDINAVFGTKEDSGTWEGNHWRVVVKEIPSFYMAGANDSKKYLEIMFIPE
jgi:hypothetical protein